MHDPRQAQEVKIFRLGREPCGLAGLQSAQRTPLLSDTCEVPRDMVSLCRILRVTWHLRAALRPSVILGQRFVGPEGLMHLTSARASMLHSSQASRPHHGHADPVCIYVGVFVQNCTSILLPVHIFGSCTPARRAWRLELTSPPTQGSSCSGMQLSRDNVPSTSSITP